MYRITDLVKTYDKRVILNNISLSFEAGKFYALLGKNGSGKSTLMKLLAQQELFDKGNIQFVEKNLTSPFIKIAHHIAYINEEIQMPVSATIEQWGRHFSKIHKNYNRDLLLELSSLFQIDQMNQFENLSRGQKVKAYFSLHAAKRPDVYILDEITAVLDSHSRLSLMRFLNEEYKRGALVILSTNIASELQSYATDLCFLEKGTVVFSSPTDKISQLFYKCIASEEEIAKKKLLEKGFRYVERNSNSLWSLLCMKEIMPNNLELLEDRRSISINEIATYYTGVI